MQSDSPHAILSRMVRQSLTRPVNFGAWTLCLLFLLISTLPQNCALCDHVSLLRSAHQAHTALAPIHYANKQSTHQPDKDNDTCGEVCSCCGFHWAPRTATPSFAFTQLSRLAPETATRGLEQPLPLPRRPPRA
jgi:hypothetical protein